MRKWWAMAAIGLAAVAVLIRIGFLAVGGRGLRIDAILAACDDTEQYGKLVIRRPFDETLFPRDGVAPAFQWEDASPDSDAWLITLQFSDGLGRMNFLSDVAEWTPSEEAWNTIKQRSLERRAKVTILGVNRSRQDRILSAATISIGTSRDEVGAPIFYREVTLPFIEAVKVPSRIRWRFGTISSRQQPPVVLEGLPVCANCHSFSTDGKTLGMDVDYANDKGSYAVMPVAPEMVLEPSRIISWSQYQPEDRQPTFGLLSQVSPDGKYVVSTVKDESVFVPRENLAFSQLFFPLKGVLAVYCRETGTFRSLPGADDPTLVQSNPAWSPDGKYVVFARSKAHHLRRERTGKSVLLSKEECQEFLEEGKTFLFDLYRIPFNEGRGGKAEPLEGASHNGVSNYFPRYSPDGKWIVFCRARTFMLLQPDSELYIIPAGGGQAQRLRGNTSRMNSWHSWSPNGKWLVFASKAFSDYTQLFLTHVDEHGESTPPVLLAHFTSPGRAANIPEFVNARSDEICKIHERYLNDYSFARAAQTNLMAGDPGRAEEACRRALKLNPKSPEALCNLGIALRLKGKHEEAEGCLRDAIRYGPTLTHAYANLGSLLCDQKRVEEGLVYLRKAEEIDPDLFAARFALGTNLVKTGRFAEGAEHLAVAVQLRPNHVKAQYFLGLALQRQGKPEEALVHYVGALRQDPDFVPALLRVAAIRAAAEPSLRNGAEAIQSAERACRLTEFKDPESLMVLADAHAAAGQYAEACTAAQRALEVARAAGWADYAAAIQKRLSQYLQKGQLAPPKAQP